RASAPAGGATADCLSEWTRATARNGGGPGGRIGAGLWGGGCAEYVMSSWQRDQLVVGDVDGGRRVARLPPGRKGHISMDGSVLDPEGARERLAAWKGRIDQLAANTKAMSDRLQQLQETVADPRGLAKVTVDSTGSLIGLQLTSRIQEIGKHTSELQSRENLVCRLLLEKKKKNASQAQI